jgi:phosphate transport system permease protein
MKIKFFDTGFKKATTLVALCVVALMLFLVLSMTINALPSLQKFKARFLFTSTWDPVKEIFGALPFIYGTIVSSLLALLIAVPVSLGIAIYLAELAPQFIRQPLSFLIELLAAIPSVVYGLWGIFGLAPILRWTVQPILSRYLGFLPIFQGEFYGVGMLTAGVILSIMIIPTISAVCREVFLAVPFTQREAALALGATSWETIRLAVLGYGKSGMWGAVILGLGRALGETMAVTMVIGNRPEISASLFAPSYTMASVIANEFTEATSNLYLSALIEIGLVLFLVTLLVNIFARLLIWRVAGKVKGGIRE